MDVALVLTHDCNLACPYCYAGEKLGRHMPEEVARAGLALASHDGAERCQVSFFGGEPMLAFELLERYTRMAREMLEPEGVRLRFVVTTNGTCFTAERLAFLAQERFFVGLSIDGVAAAHNATRPFTSGRDSFEAVHRGLRRLMRSGVDFETITVIDPDNVAYLGESVRFLVGQGVRRIGLNPNFEAEWSDEALEVWAEGYREVAELWKACYRRGHQIHINVIDDKILTHLKGGYTLCDRCEFGRSAIAVAPSGNIYPCERMVGEDRDDRYCIGTVFEGFSPLRRGLIEASGNHNPDCDGCTLRDRCMSWCACANIAETGRLDQPGGLVCWHEQSAIAAADEAAHALYEESNPTFLSNYYLR